ncbi:hypothetical protein GCM10027515_31870 [Schumannella luteola]|uniref:Uncharacterized protein n=1 Tax=Schumannella luteola TaxID=472059 RepID=A0A852YAZ3_9MICO|nr:hypothetical protein [Schumannella luteola]NYG99012.1 hypothetical protein [Schumannella luteola]TPX06372.1 hypothetical protein FJ656_01695 [Schumannella luteola]
MTKNLKARARQLEAELRSRRDARSDTERQIDAARGINGRPAEPEYKPEAEWTTTERQLHAHRGIRPVINPEGEA